GGVFTRSSTRSADVDWCRQALADGEGQARALVVNAGNSNAFTGQAGVEKNTATINAMSKLAECPPEQVFIAATGVIGEPMTADLVANALPEAFVDMGPPNWEKAASAFMTTDTFPKGAGATTDIDGVPTAIAGIAKGSGMIAPNMATMLAYIFTDAALSPAVCQALVARYAETTFNCVTVDGDTSTSDTLMLFATGAAGGPLIEDLSDPRLEVFSSALEAAMTDLAIQLARDGEGASKLIEISVAGGADDRSAKTIAAAIANSPLVKTALAASDANWGRIVMAVGKSGEPVARDKLSIYIGDVEAARGGARSPTYSEAAASAAVAGREVTIKVNVGVAEGRARVWTCDLTHGYVDINGAY
ncbi:MAG: bifunctional glutamate N-acetyltransferase/amino-acid acetyltransferase ArgJ, partial [Pseudomonadota bacterium]